MADQNETRSLPPVEEGTVCVVRYDPRWPQLYALEAAIVVRAFAGRAIKLQHFGSTAVLGLDAKPIVDILAASTDTSPPDASLIEALSVEGYTFLGEDGRRPGRWFWRKRGADSFNLSLVPLDSALWEDNLLVRDFLRAHSEEVAQYAAVKHEAVQRSPNSLLGYQEHKRAYVQRLLSRAHEWQRSQQR